MMENKNWKIFILCFIVVLLMIFLVFLTVELFNNEFANVNTNESINVDTSVDVKNVIEYMKDNNITIYGSTKCSYCQKQLKEFQPYQEEAIEEGVFIFCDLNQDIGCIGLKSVPSWKKDGKIVHEGYLPLEEIGGNYSW